MRWRSRRTRGWDVIREKNHECRGRRGEKRIRSRKREEKGRNREEKRFRERSIKGGKWILHGWRLIVVVVDWEDLESVARDRGFSFRVNSLSPSTVRSTSTVHIQPQMYSVYTMKNNQVSSPDWPLVFGIWSTGTEYVRIYGTLTNPSILVTSYSLTIGILPIGLGFHFHGEMELDKRMRACKYICTPKYGCLYQILYQPCKYVLTLLSNSLMIIVLLVKR